MVFYIFCLRQKRLTDEAPEVGLSVWLFHLALLARAFVKDPDLIILDEPLHGLDVSNKKKVAAIIEQFCSRPGKTLIYVTHRSDEPAWMEKV